MTYQELYRMLMRLRCGVYSCWRCKASWRAFEDAWWEFVNTPVQEGDLCSVFEAVEPMTYIQVYLILTELLCMDTHCAHCERISREMAVIWEFLSEKERSLVTASVAPPMTSKAKSE